MILFSKMHVNGNDFMVLDNRDCTIPLPTSAIVKKWSDRRRGVGFDQLLWITLPNDSGRANLSCKIFNAAGSLADQCGHGMACLLKWWHIHIGQATSLTIEVPAGISIVSEAENGNVLVDLGPPMFDSDATATSASLGRSRLSLLSSLTVPHQLLKDQQRLFNISNISHDLYVGRVSIGNPHCVVWLKEFDSLPENLGLWINQHPQFRTGVNVEFMKVVSRQKLMLRVYERGVGETPACGTGACAAFVIARQWGLVESSAEVQFSGGSIVRVQWPSVKKSVLFETSVHMVFQGRIG